MRLRLFTGVITVVAMLLAAQPAAALPGMGVALEAAGMRDADATAAQPEAPAPETPDVDETEADDTSTKLRRGPDPETTADDTHEREGIANVGGTDAEGVSEAGRLGLAWRIMRIERADAGASRSLGSLRDCPDAPTCDAYRLGKARWPTDDAGRAQIRFAYSDIGRPDEAPGAGAVLASVRASVAAWERWNPNVRFTYTGTSDAPFNARGEDGSCDDGTNVVTWRRLQTEALAATAICYDTKTYEIRDVDLALNSLYDWADFSHPDPDADAYDVRSIVTHEIGHFLSLFDLRSRIRESAQTMYEAAEPGETRKRTLALGDVLGAQAAYPCGGRCPTPSGLVDD